MKRGIFVGEGSSDRPLADIVTQLFTRRGIAIEIAAPDFSLLPAGKTRDLTDKITAARRLTASIVDVFVVHRDADGADPSPRFAEVQQAVDAAAPAHRHLPVVPVTMTEAWLLLDERAIRMVAGNPDGRTALNLPQVHEVERRSNPKAILAQAILMASGKTGRRRDRLTNRFGHHRRRLLEQLDLDGPVTRLRAWQDLEQRIEALADEWATG